jgi:hypothetical protein
VEKLCAFLVEELPDEIEDLKALKVNILSDLKFAEPLAKDSIKNNNNNNNNNTNIEEGKQTINIPGNR